MNEEKKYNAAAFKDAVDDFDRFEDFFHNYWRQIIIGAVVVVVLVGLGSFTYQGYSRRQMDSASALSGAETLDELRAALSKHGGHRGAAAARLRLSVLLYDAEQYEEALSELSPLLQPGAVKSISVYWQARLNECYILERLGRRDAAAEAFSVLGSEFDVPEFVRDEANVNAGRLFIAENKLERAKASLQAVNTGKGYTEGGFFWAQQAEKLIEGI